MKKITWIFVLLTCLFITAFANPQLPTGWWRASIMRMDGHTIDFNVSVQYKKGKPVWFIRNATEKIEVTAIEQKQDSIIVQMPLFESEFRLQAVNNNSLRGVWIKGTSTSIQILPVVFTYNQSQRYPQAKSTRRKVTGRWGATFIDNSNTPMQAVVEFKQNGTALTGTVLTPTGDYRYLEGAVNNDTLQLSTFDGSHAYYFRGTIHNDSIITDGLFFSGATYKENWTAQKDEKASIPDTLAAAYIKPGEERLNFRFPDLDSNLVSINDDRFRNKVVIIQVMGSWCPNCMDETAFLSEYYKANKQRGVEMIALAYEYSTDFQRSKKSLRKFQQHFNITYPMLITGVRVADTLRTEKTLPQITRIKMFPTTLFIGRDGKLKKIHTGFYGPGAGAHYEAYKKEFYATVDELLKGSL
ncbi:TlpA family protein disulfide reductase [Niastella caeni]|uniref:TlpA family protein disulfide reductase n=1 Tax=Niastella caeni TaxID=2569763 RepID=A0A4S8HWG1_9BACT|nr:TlpA disulfide reductase family protein [Niastella caeni]THU39970.1 TlpA family protein disulfide reductase [Niastella caeni]